MADETFQVDQPNPYSSSGSSSGGGGLLRGCLIGCGVLSVVLLIAMGVGGYFFYRFASKSFSTDPVVINGWLQEVVECQIPDGYEGKMGLNPSIGEFTFTMIVILPDDVALEGNQGRQATIFMVFRGPAAMSTDELQKQFELQQAKQARQQGNERRDVEEETIEVQVADHQTTATKTTWKENGTAMVSYSLTPKKSVIVFAAGPQDHFDQQAFDAFLKSMKVPPPADGSKPPEKSSVDQNHAAKPGESKEAEPVDADASRK